MGKFKDYVSPLRPALSLSVESRTVLTSAGAYQENGRVYALRLPS